MRFDARVENMPPRNWNGLMPMERIAVRSMIHPACILELDNVYVSPFQENGKD